MEKFTRLSSRVMPLPLGDIDTDMIIPAQYLTSVSREGYAENLFRRMRDTDPEFPLNKAEFTQAKILACGDNFGCGSSREHAVWALLGAGFKALISTSFADIFSSNSGKNGLVLVKVGTNELEEILAGAASGNYEVEVDLEKQLLTLPGGRGVTFPFDPFRKHCILNGLDDLDFLISKSSEIKKYRESRKQFRFFDSNKPNN